MQDLIRGIVDFRERLLPAYAARFRELAHAQSPDALFVTCSDSRVVPDLLVSTDPGELFTMRNVGNLIPPATSDGLSVGDVSEASAIEYAVLVLGVAHIVVCGHSGCGAMKAVVERHDDPAAPNLHRWLEHAMPAVSRLAHDGALDPTRKVHDQLSQHNVLVQLEHLMTYPIVKSRVASGELQLSAWWFDIASGDMMAYDREAATFHVIDREMADKMVARLARSGATRG